jgi:AcrR family transcriptional regulator
MARRKITIGLLPLATSVAARGSGAVDDPGVERILDAAAELLAAYGLKRWSIEDVAERAGIGRTSVYRAFAGRDDLVHAVLARELRQTLTAMELAGAPFPRLEDQIVEGAIIAFSALRGSLVDKLLRSDPATLLPFLTTGAGPLIALTRELIVGHARAANIELDELPAAEISEIAEIAARLGLSFVLTRETVFPIDQPDQLRNSLHRLLSPLLVPLTKAHRRPA